MKAPPLSSSVFNQDQGNCCLIILFSPISEGALSNAVCKDLTEIGFCLQRLILTHEMKSCSKWFREQTSFYQSTASSSQIIFALISLQ